MKINTIPKSTTNIQLNHFKSIFRCPKSFPPQGGRRSMDFYDDKQTNKQKKKHRREKKQENKHDMIIIIIVIITVLIGTIPQSTTNIHIHYFKTTLMCPRSIAGVPYDSVEILRTTFVPYTNCMHSSCNWRANCVAAYKNQKPNLIDDYDYFGAVVSARGCKLSP